MKIKKETAPDLILFGGSFDPPHQGHCETLSLLKSRFSKSEIKVLPSYSPPLNKSETKAISASFEERVAMCDLAFKKLPVEILRVEEGFEKPNYTVQTLNFFSKQHKNAHLAFAIGYDQFLNFHTWKRPKDILLLSSLILIPRTQKYTQDNLNTFCKKLSIDSPKFLDSSIDIDPYMPLFFLEKSPFQVSSTEIRNRIFKGEEVIGIDAAVMEYIRNHRLYREGS